MNRYFYVAALQDDEGVGFFSCFVESEDESMAYDDGYVQFEEHLINVPEDLDRFLNDYVVELGPAMDLYQDGYSWDPVAQQYYLR